MDGLESRGTELEREFNDINTDQGMYTSHVQGPELILIFSSYIVVQHRPSTTNRKEPGYWPPITRLDLLLGPLGA